MASDLVIPLQWWTVIFMFLVFAWGHPCLNSCNAKNYYFQGLEGEGTRLVLGDFVADLAVGDALMIIQMQGGNISNSNDLNYGADQGTGNGFTDVGTAGQYEFASVASVAKPNVTLLQPLQFNYSSTGNNRFQVILVSLCKEVNVSNPFVPAWNGYVGGVLVVIAERINLGNVSLEGKGFRGGPSIRFGAPVFFINQTFLPQSFRDNSTAARQNDSSAYNAPKGEGFIGSPSRPSSPITARDEGSTPETTYPDGANCARGAPGNAGGGSNWSDMGGGGGANGGRGGDGGRFSPEPYIVGEPGIGGAPAPSNASNRIFLGKKACWIEFVFI